MSGLPYTLPAFLPSGASTYVVTASPEGGAAGDLDALVSHCQSAADLLIGQYQDLPLFRAWLCSFLDRLQDVDLALAIAFQHALSIETAQGAQLDLIGRIVREARDGRADDPYRRALRVRILVNRSQGRVEDLIAIASLFEDDASVRVREYAPARVVVYMGGVSVNPPTALHARLRRAKAAGVALQTVVNSAAPDAGADATRIFQLGVGPASVDPSNLATGLGIAGFSYGGYLSTVVG